MAASALMRPLLACLVVVLLAACATSPPPPPAEERGWVLRYVEVRDGREAGQWRVMLTPRWLRLDRGTSGAEYWLVALPSGPAYRVDAGGQGQKIDVPPEPRPLDWEVSREPSRALTFGLPGAAWHLRFAWREQPCLDAVVLPDAAPWVRDGLAWIPRLPETDIPLTGAQSCAQALRRDPLAPWRAGLVLRLWDGAGNGWFLVDQRQGAVLPGLLFLH